jgi:hypothetical protein
MFVLVDESQNYVPPQASAVSNIRLYFENIVTLSDALTVLRLVAANRHSLSITVRAKSKRRFIKTQLYFLEMALVMNVSNRIPVLQLLGPRSCSRYGTLAGRV